MSTFGFIFWIGGVSVSYRRCRLVGKSKASAAFDAFCWPFGFGAWVAAHAFDPNT